MPVVPRSLAAGYARAVARAPLRSARATAPVAALPSRACGHRPPSVPPSLSGAPLATRSRPAPAYGLPSGSRWQVSLPSGSTLAPSPTNSLRFLRQQYSGVRVRVFCSGRAGSACRAACSPCAGGRSRSVRRSALYVRMASGRARPLHVAWRSRSGRAGLGLLACLRAPNRLPAYGLPSGSHRQVSLPSGSQLAPSPTNSLRFLRQQYSGVRVRFFCSGRAGSSYLAACPTFAGGRSRSACLDPPCGRHKAGRARPLHVAWRSRSGRAGLGLLAIGGSPAPVTPARSLRSRLPPCVFRFGLACVLVVTACGMRSRPVAFSLSIGRVVAAAASGYRSPFARLAFRGRAP